MALLESINIKIIAKIISKYLTFKNIIFYNKNKGGGEYMAKKSVCFTFSLYTMEKIDKFVTENSFSTRTGFLIFLIHEYHPKLLYRDPYYSTETKKVVSAMLTQAEIRSLENLCEKHGCKKAAYGRHLVYTFSHQEQEEQDKLLRNFKDY